MRDLKPLTQKISIKGREFDVAFNINTMDEIQEDMGIPVTEFINKLCEDPTNTGCFKEIRYLLQVMINEGIEIWNDENPQDKKEKLSLHQVGSLLDLEGIVDIKMMVLLYILSTFPAPDEKNTPIEK